jgi:hypothetical protein
VLPPILHFWKTPWISRTSLFFNIHMNNDNDTFTVWNKMLQDMHCTCKDNKKNWIILAVTPSFLCSQDDKCWLYLQKLRGLSPWVNYTERPPLVGEVSANFCGQRVPSGQHDGSLRPYYWISRPALYLETEFKVDQ